MTRVDPDGHCDASANRSSDACWQQYFQLQSKYQTLPTGADGLSLTQLTDLGSWLQQGMKFAGQWSSANLGNALAGFGLVRNKMFGGNYAKMYGALRDKSGVAVTAINGTSPGGGSTSGRIKLYMTATNDPENISTAAHETGHPIGLYLGRTMKGLKFTPGVPQDSYVWSDEWMNAGGWSNSGGSWTHSKYTVSMYAQDSPNEDFAETVAAYSGAATSFNSPFINMSRLDVQAKFTLLDALVVNYLK